MKAIVSVLLLALTATLALAQGCDVGAPNAALYCNAITVSCDVAYFRNKYTNLHALQSSPTAASEFALCASNGRGGCCVDGCHKHSKNADKCAEEAGCAVVPGGGNTINCMRRDKICGMLPLAQCGNYFFCSNASNQCLFAEQSNPKLNDNGASVGDKCDGLHPVVIVVLVLMFLTLVGGIVLVGIVVWRNQRQADEEDALAAEAEAEEERQKSTNRAAYGGL